MSLYVFLALCILGTGFMTYAFFQLTYGDKHGAGVRQIAAHKKGFREQSHRPYLVPSTEAGRLLFAQEACQQTIRFKHYAKRFCDHGECALSMGGNYVEAN